MTKTARSQSLVIGVGGFLGIGEKNVTYDFAKASGPRRTATAGWLSQTTKEQLQAQPDFDRKVYDPVPADDDVRRRRAGRLRQPLARLRRLRLTRRSGADGQDCSGSGGRVAPM